MRQTRAIGYRRVSTSQQRLGGYSLPQQKLEIEAYAAAHNIKLVGDYADDQTGTNMARPGLEQALAALQAGEATALIICESDRLTRSAPDYMWLRETLREMGAELHNARRGHINLDDFGSQIVEDVYGRVAEQERRRIIERMRGGKLSKARQGLVVNPTILPYGYKAAEGLVVIEPAEAAVVVEIFNLYISGGLTLTGIAAELTQRREPTYTDRRRLKWSNKTAAPGHWLKGSVRAFLRNRTYTGVWHYNKTDAAGQPNPPAEWVAVNVPAIIDEATFEAAQNKLIENKARASRNTRREYLAQGRVTCTCGQAMRCKSSRGSSGKLHSYYVCGPACQNLRASDLDAALWCWLKRLLAEPDYLAGLVADYLENEERTQAGVTGKLDDVRGRLARNLERQKRLATAFVNGDIDDEALGEVGAGLRAEKEALLAEERRQVEALGNLAQARDHAAEIMRLMSTFNHGLRFFNDEPFYIRRGWVEALNASVEVQPGAKTARFTCLFGADILSIVGTVFRCRDLNWQLKLSAILPIREEASCGSNL